MEPHRARHKQPQCTAHTVQVTSLTALPVNIHTGHIYLSHKQPQCTTHTVQVTSLTALPVTFHTGHLFISELCSPFFFYHNMFPYML